MHTRIWYFPTGHLSVLNESWAGERPLPFSIGKNPEEYLQSLKDNLEMARAYAYCYSEIEQNKYVTHYNLRSTDRQYQLGDKVIISRIVVGIAAQILNQLRHSNTGPRINIGIITQARAPATFASRPGPRPHITVASHSNIQMCSFSSVLYALTSESCSNNHFRFDVTLRVPSSP